MLNTKIYYKQVLEEWLINKKKQQRVQHSININQL